MVTEALISVIIPVYNAEKFIGRCIDSVIDGTYKNVEIICVNDGSRDSSLSLLKEYEKKDSRIKVIDKENGGVSSARNAGMDAAGGEYIAFIDADDWIHRSCLEIMVNAACSENADIIKCSHKVVNKTEAQTDIDAENSSVRPMTDSEAENLHYVWGLLYKSEVIKKYRFSEKLILSEDMLFNMTLVATELDDGNQLKCVCTDEQLYYYFQHADSALSKITHEKGQKESAEEYLNCAESAKSKRTRRMYLDRVFKAIFSYRYSGMIRCDKNEVRSTVKRLSRRALRLLPETDFSFSKKLIYIVMTFIPQTYSFMRKTVEKKAKKQS